VTNLHVLKFLNVHHIQNCEGGGHAFQQTISVDNAGALSSKAFWQRREDTLNPYCRPRPGLQPLYGALVLLPRVFQCAEPVLQRPELLVVSRADAAALRLDLAHHRPPGPAEDDIPFSKRKEEDGDTGQPQWLSCGGAVFAIVDAEKRR
jgi:hypothetical protein